LPSAADIFELFTGVKDGFEKRLLANKTEHYDTKEYYTGATSRLASAVADIPVRARASGTAADGTVRINLIIDQRDNIKAQTSGGYERWAKMFNLKQAAQTLAFLEENGLASYGKLTETADAAQKEFTEVRANIASAEQRLKDNAAAQKYLRQYARTRAVYGEYKKSGYSKTFRQEHEKDIREHREAKKFFDGLVSVKGKNFPKISELKEEYAEILAEKKQLYPRYGELKARTGNVIAARKNIDLYLGIRARDAYARTAARRGGAPDTRGARREG
jgi:hypothetical protein